MAIKDSSEGEPGGGIGSEDEIVLHLRPGALELARAPTDPRHAG